MASTLSEIKVLTAPTDRRLYRIVHLDNGLTALLVHDPEIFPNGIGGDHNQDNGEDLEDEETSDSEDGDEKGVEEMGEDDDGDQKKEKEVAPTKKAAAAMCVGVGSFSDPVEAQGLAHFLEHMLFMGSSVFPDENEYDSYLSKHGGSSNAYTETEHTCYYFDVGREYLSGALERFSQFFVSPLIKADSMEREILAVDSEFNQVLQSDRARLQQLQCHTSDVSHPFHCFCWGNRQSLCSAEEKGINLRESLIQLFNKYYHGGLMKLVVIGGESLDILQAWVVELFGKIRTGDAVTLNPQPYTCAWNAGKMYRLDAVKETHVLHLSWTLPCLHKEYLKKPDGYLAHLLGHEGRGSLLFYLKERGWATSLSAGVDDSGMDRSSVNYIFVVAIHLTESGLNQVHEIIGLVYQYLKLLRHIGPRTWVFKELHDIGNMEFKFSEEQPQDDYAVELAENLLLYTEEHVIYGQYAFEVWDSELIKRILSFLVPDNMRIDLISKSSERKLADNLREPWFGSCYTEEDLSPDLLHTWKNPPEINPCLHLPARNEFIARDFSLHCPNLPFHGTEAGNPTCIIDEQLLKVWYKHDPIFKVPRANTYFFINVKGVFRSIKSLVLTELYVDLLKDKLNETLYQASVAKLESSFSFVSDKLELKIYGFNEKLQILLKEILEMSKFSPSADRFQIIKEDKERSYRNANMKPLNHSTQTRLRVLRKKFYHVDDKLSCLMDISVDDLLDFLPELLSEMHMEGLCHGNLSEDDVVSISSIFKTAFPVQPLPMEARHQEHILNIPSGICLSVDVPVKNESETNSVVELYYQIDRDIGEEATRLRVIADLFEEIVREPFFDQLRTKEQLGYTVRSGTRMTFRVLGFCFVVQSSEYDPLYVRERIDHFVRSLKTLLIDLDASSFENFHSGLIEQKLEKDPSLIHETNRYWNQIVDKRYMFDMLKVEVEELRKIQKSDVIDWYDTYLSPEAPKCRRLSVHVWGCNTLSERQEKARRMLGEAIYDLDAFKRSSHFYPSPLM